MSLYVTLGSKGCPQCKSEDFWKVVERVEAQGLVIEITRFYCNPCGYNDVTVQIGGRAVYHSIRKEE